MEDNVKKLGQEPAFPCINADRIPFNNGASKRFYAACAAMQGILGNKNANPTRQEHFQNIIEDAYKLADELLKQENDE
jgi:hypothetical protein